MPLDDSWVVENRILLLTFSGAVGIDDVSASIPIIDQYAARCDEKFYIIVDALSTSGIRFNMKALGDSMKLRVIPNLVSTVFILNNTLMRFSAAVTMQLIRREFKIVNTMDEAKRYLELIHAMPDSNASSDSTQPPV